MISTTDLAKLEQLVSRLPFQLDDFLQANAAYKMWVKHGRREDQKIVDLWTYCFIWRNLIIKFSRNADLNPSDFDMLVARVFQRIVERRYTVRDETRYTNWVSVICRNFFVNYLRTLNRRLSMEDMASFEAVEAPVEFEDDLVILHKALSNAIDRLPKYLRRVVSMRLFEQKSYEEIAEAMDKKVEVIRSYFNKAIKIVREDKQFRRLIEREFREDVENRGM